MMKTNKLETRKILRNFIINSFIKDNGAQLDDDLSFIDEGIIDSVGVLELVAFLETTFHLRVEDEELMPTNLDSVNRLVTFVESKIAKKLVSS